MSVYDVTGLAHSNTVGNALDGALKTASIIDKFDYRKEREQDREWLTKQREWQEQDRVLNQKHSAEDREYQLGQREHQGVLQTEELRQMEHNRDVVEPMQMQHAQEDRAYQQEVRNEERQSRSHKRKQMQLDLAYKEGLLETNSYNRQTAELQLNEAKATSYDKKAQKAVTQLERLVKNRSTDRKMIDKVTKEVEEILGADLGNPGQLVQTVNKAVELLRQGAPLDAPEMQEAMTLVMGPDMIRSGRQGNFTNPRVMANPNKPNRYVTAFDYPDGKKTGYATVAQGTEGDEVATEFGRVEAMQSLLEYKRLVGNIAALNTNAATGTGGSQADLNAKYNQHTGEYYSGRTGETIRKAEPLQSETGGRSGSRSSPSAVDLDVRYNEDTGDYYSSTTGDILQQGEGRKKTAPKATIDYFDNKDDLDGAYIAKQLGEDATVSEVNAVKQIATEQEIDPDSALQTHRNTKTMDRLKQDVLSAEEYADIPKRQKETIVQTAAETLEPGQSLGQAVQERLQSRLKMIQTLRQSKQLLKDTGKDPATNGLPRSERQRIIQTAVADGVEDLEQIKQMMVERAKTYHQDVQDNALQDQMFRRGLTHYSE